MLRCWESRPEILAIEVDLPVHYLMRYDGYFRPSSSDHHLGHTPDRWTGERPRRVSWGPSIQLSLTPPTRGSPGVVLYRRAIPDYSSVATRAASMIRRSRVSRVDP